MASESAVGMKNGFKRRIRGSVRCMSGFARSAVAVSVFAFGPLPRGAAEERPHPALEDAPQVTQNADGVPGDPINLALVATEEEIHLAMLAAKWIPADQITLRSSVRITADTVAHRPYPNAPVSNLYLWGRRQDVAFEQPVGDSPRQRHHVRFWRSEKTDADGRPLWLGAATFDTRVGLSETRHITHHIAPDVDSERDKILQDVDRSDNLAGEYWVEGFHENTTGKNAGGDPYLTDGRLAIGVIAVRR